MFCANVQSHESLAHIRHYFPKSYELFEEMIGGWKEFNRLLAEYAARFDAAAAAEMVPDLRRSNDNRKQRHPALS